MAVGHLVDYSKRKTCNKNGTTSLKIFTLIILAVRNNVAKLHSYSLHRSGKINNNILKL
jgi:hypothetical protein